MQKTVRVACTRKTTPGFRLYEKKAVFLGGGDTHRLNLSDVVLIKDNHIVVAGGISEAIQRARRYIGHMIKIEVEVDTLEQLAAWQTLVNQHLPPLENDIEHFGEQFVVDETGEFVRREMQLLLTSADLSLEEAIGAVDSFGGLAIPAHVDRKANGLLEVLGFVPPNVTIEALEVSRHISTEV